MNSQFKKGVLELCVLALVAHKDSYGYELVQELSQRIDVVEGTIYPILRRLTDEGYFETYLRESSGGPPRKYYRITSQGRRFFESLRADWEVFNKNVNKILKSGVQK